MNDMKLSKDDLEYVFGKGLNDTFIEQTLLTINTYRLNFGISKRIDIVRFLAQAYHEIQFKNTKNGKVPRMRENLNFSDGVLIRLSSYWRNNQEELAEVRKMWRSEQKRIIMNKWYNGRMGNRIGSNDGYTFVGAGAFMVTGRDNHLRVLELIEKSIFQPMLTEDKTPIDGIYERYDVFWLMGMAYWRLMGGYTCNSTLDCTNKVNRGLPLKEKMERTATAVRINQKLFK